MFLVAQKQINHVTSTVINNKRAKKEEVGDKHATHSENHNKTTSQLKVNHTRLVENVAKFGAKSNVEIAPEWLGDFFK